MEKRIVLKIFGKVQGVFFRDSCRVEARKLGLFGWARNEEDGTVQILAEGEEEKLKELIRWCEDGPEYAKVEKVDTEWLPATGKFEDFSIN